MNSTRRGVMAAAGVALFAAGSAVAQPRGAKSATAELARLRATLPIPAVSGAVAREPGRALWQGAAGMADLELRRPATPPSRFRLGSCSKVVTAAAAMRLVEQGRLDLDVPVATYLPDLPEHHRRTTLRQLLGHQGGVRHYNIKDLNPAQPGGTADVRTFKTTEEMLAIFIDDPLVSPPGEAVNYSTFGFTMISAAMEKAAGAGFPEIIQREVAAPLDLRLEAETSPKLMTDRVRPYELASRPGREGPKPDAPVVNAPPVDPSYKWAGGGLLGSAPDLARFGAGLLRPGYLRAVSLEQLFTPRPARKGPGPVPLGLAWRIDKDAKGRRRFHHAGAIQGGRAAVAIYPDLGLAVGLCSNLSETPNDPLGPIATLADAFVG